MSGTLRIAIERSLELVERRLGVAQGPSTASAKVVPGLLQFLARLAEGHDRVSDIGVIRRRSGLRPASREDDHQSDPGGARNETESLARHVPIMG